MLLWNRSVITQSMYNNNNQPGHSTPPVLQLWDTRQLQPNAPAIQSSVSSTPNLIGSNGMAKDCAGCGKRITERFLLKALDLFWHEDCLKCGCCDCRLGEVGSTLYTKANLILCKRDYLRLFGTTGYCAACNKVIPAFEMVMRAKNNVYHLECFACQQCNHRFCVGDRFYLCDYKILCEYDYEERLVFASMACNPSSLAHIRRQVSNLQPAGENLIGNVGSGRMPPAVNRSPYVADKLGLTQQQQQQGLPQQQQHPPVPSNQQTQHHPHPPQQSPQQQSAGGSHLQNPTQQQHHPSNLGPHRDDGSSGYGSPDSETFETPASQ
ncbi:LIM/homeobox protein Lhx9 [Aedes aegypti]|uniref:LIM zinc-binding domain-containing protein n=1 Tax=Aedes aegypti TaxID=7159 RepID=A0A6I8TA93_AEDAE|nr:LIM/homeobox protein Lhx9 [Aedes aegypti]XP_021706094.1 LIM/homeobox protein Lhx9 [Aedes aegypti]XP_021706096.1 LIM/homeobox protein Lhx9 [Aedes aegypti]XP_021706097.1 LIM/homeobox protein Lhx9 [Aedes aegypti]XP_021706098.1 LIM/homeobox protein Lhx9 [Aedes aegypti]